MLDAQWIEIQKIKNMTRQELRSYDTGIGTIKCLEQNKIYSIEIFDDTRYKE